MRRCPTCGASCADDDLFCEADGTKLGGAAATAPAKGASSERASGAVGAPSKAAAACDACGATASDDGDGYCSVCGHRLDHPSASPAGTDPAESSGVLAVGATLGGYVVRASRGDGATAAAADGTDAFLVIGGKDALVLEANALVELAKVPTVPTFPRVLGRDEASGFLALSAPAKAARLLADIVQGQTLEQAVAAIEGFLDAAAAVENAGFTFAPAPSDVLVTPTGGVALSRLRGARPLGAREGVNARKLLEAMGELFLASAIVGPTKLVRLLAPSREPGDRTIAAARAELEAIADELGSPRHRDSLAELCDPGLWRPYNQDATAIDHGRTAAGEPFVVLVVCDGVSSSAYSDRASRVASRAARDALGHFARSPDVEHDSAAAAVAQAIRAAHLAICAAHVADPVADPPGTTIAAAFIYKKRLTVGWVGDSRAYWLTPRGAELLTHDHSWVNEAIARGEVKDADEVQGALAHTITRCLGPLEVGDVPSEIEPEVRARDLAGSGLVLLCSDGLWNYAPKASDIAAIARAATDETDAVEVARLMINYALARGGQDNVSVAVYAHA